MANVINIPSKVIASVSQIYGIETSMPIANTGLKKPSDIIKYITKVDESKIYEAIQNSASSNSKLQDLFKDCISLVSLNLSNWTDLSSQITMLGMFQGCWSLVSLNLIGLDTSTITNTRLMFNNCSSLTELDLSNFDTSNVTTMRDMFSGCKSLAKIWIPSTFVANRVTIAANKPFYYSTGKSGGTHVFTDATDATTQGWGTINSNYIMHYGATHQDYENA